METMDIGGHEFSVVGHLGINGTIPLLDIPMWDSQWEGEEADARYWPASLLPEQEKNP
ncbi:MAG: hypothetical protein HFF38_11940 [Lawsonibacter sp.]|nr:hypothetical protein [Lawsonibacter sp.]